MAHAIIHLTRRHHRRQRLRVGSHPDPEQRSDAGSSHALAAGAWVSTWGTTLIDNGLVALLTSFEHVTLRQIIHTSVRDRQRVDPEDPRS